MSNCAILFCERPILKNGARIMEISKYETSFCAFHGDRWMLSGERKRFLYFDATFPLQASGAVMDFINRVSAEDTYARKAAETKAEETKP